MQLPWIREEDALGKINPPIEFSSRGRSGVIPGKHCSRCTYSYPNVLSSAEGEVDVQRRVCRAGCLSASPALPGAGGGGAVARSGEGPGPGACLPGRTPNDAPVTWRRGLTLVRGHLGPRVVPRRGWQPYSTEVQQLTWMRADVRGRGRTLTCTERRGWTSCRQMACKRSAIRARLAPQVRSEIRTNRTAVQQQSTATAAGWAAVRVFGSGIVPWLGLLAGHRIPGAVPALVSLSPWQMRVSSVP
jgi:hypothetical protein